MQLQREKEKRWLKVGGKGRRRKMTSGQTRENICLQFRGGPITLQDSTLWTGARINRKRMIGKYQINGRGYHRWCFECGVQDIHLAGFRHFTSGSSTQHQEAGCSICQCVEPQSHVEYRKLFPN